MTKLNTEAAGALRASWRGHLVWLPVSGRPYFVDGTSKEMTDAEVADFRRELGFTSATDAIRRATGLSLD